MEPEEELTSPNNWRKKSEKQFLALFLVQCSSSCVGSHDKFRKECYKPNLSVDVLFQRLFPIKSAYP